MVVNSLHLWVITSVGWFSLFVRTTKFGFYDYFKELVKLSKKIKIFKLKKLLGASKLEKK
jgi:hypothetical protein